MFQEHPDFKTINNQDMLWRYQDLPRYLDLLLRRKLFFNRIDKFEDPFEGTYQKNDTAAGVVATINTWHLNEDENYAMWNIYARGDYGLAVQTTFKNLKQSFRDTQQPIYIGKVQYYNDKEAGSLPENPCIPYLLKRHIYRYENEVRCCYIVTEQESSSLPWEEQGIYNGVFIDVLPEVLIERIYISPYSPPWFRELIVLLNRRFHIDTEVVHSRVLSYERLE